MVSPVRKHDSYSPRKTRKHYARPEEEPNDANLDTSFDLFDNDSSNSAWYSIRIPGILPAKRSFHSSAIINNKYQMLNMYKITIECM